MWQLIYYVTLAPPSPSLHPLTFVPAMELNGMHVSTNTAVYYVTLAPPSPSLHPLTCVPATELNGMQLKHVSTNTAVCV